MENKSFLGTIAILLATLFWGMTFAFIKDAISALSPLNFLFWRFGIASVLLLVLFWKKIKFDRTIFIYGTILGIFLAGTVIFQTIGLQYTAASTASFITGLSVIIVAVLEAIFNKTRPSLNLSLAVVLAITGIGLITLSDGLSINVGDIWILLCAFCFASYIIFAGKASHLHAALSLTCFQSVFVCVITGGLVVLKNEISVPQHLHVWLAILFCSVFASIVAFILQLQFQKYVSSTKAAIIFSLEPVFATLTAVIYLGEQISLRFFMGAFMIFVAILLAEKRTEQKVIPQE